MPGATILGLGPDERHWKYRRNISRKRSVAWIGAECAMNREAGGAREHWAEFRAVDGPGITVQEPVPTGKAV